MQNVYRGKTGTVWAPNIMRLADRYLYKFMPYGAAAQMKSNLGLGAGVVLTLLSVVQNTSTYNIFIHNFFRHTNGSFEAERIFTTVQSEKIDLVFVHLCRARFFQTNTGAGEME